MQHILQGNPRQFAKPCLATLTQFPLGVASSIGLNVVPLYKASELRINNIDSGMHMRSAVQCQYN